MAAQPRGFYVGNQEQERDHKQWLVGSFRDQSTPLYDGHVEIKVAHHKAGDQRTREKAAKKQSGRTIELLISGHFKMSFDVEGRVVEYNLTTNGDNFLVWPAGYAHWSQAVEDTHIITIGLK